ncbi:hypothetical protein B005_0328 [Nocardiopsis alba ATCC BAA-2165]|uniref:Uncharacterized protein n=1 Tax=Nocardiopsis alba (strain ATCC BAA-2165 / BE74) TaxID=1205910 RepID=J7L2R2_NOCAA|nr:hypothetical protein B005_0328 [Nocardiopsis alba ATCC BAA-2165]
MLPDPPPRGEFLVFGVRKGPRLGAWLRTKGLGVRELIAA